MSEQSKSKGRKIEGYWDCPQCGKKKIRGRYRYCDSCGRPRGNGVKFYMLDRTYAENQDEISDEPDWYCSFCQSLNSAKSKVCESCGSSQADSDKNYFAMLAEDEKKKEKKDKQLIIIQNQIIKNIILIILMKIIRILLLQMKQKSQKRQIYFKI